MNRNTPPRRLYLQEIIGLILVVGILLLFAFADFHLLVFAFALLGIALGVVGITRPQLMIYGIKTPEQIARDRRLFKIYGYLLLPMGIFILMLLLIR